MNVSVVLLFSRLEISPEPFKLIILVLMFGLSFCMVSSFKYKSCKKVSVFKSMKFNRLVGLILILVAIATEPSILLFVVFSIYVISGPVTTLVYQKYSKRDKAAPADKGF